MTRYLEGVSVAAIGRGTRRMLAPLKARHGEASTTHTEAVAAYQERRTKARAIKDPSERAKALDALRGERPTHPTLVAAGCAVVAAVVGWPLLDGHQGAVAGGALTLWLITALILGQQTPATVDRKKAAEETSSEAGSADQEAAEEQSAEAPRPTAPTPAEARLVVATLGASSEAHIPLSSVTARLAAAHPRWKHTTEATKALLDEAGIRWRSGVKVRGNSVVGIHHDDVPPLPSPAEAPSCGVVVAGQSNNNNRNNPEEGLPREGFTSQPHPTEPNRTIVIHHAA